MYTPASSAFAALVARKGGGGGHSSSHSSSSDGESSSHPDTGENDSGQASSDSKPHIPVTVSGSSKEMVAYGGGGGKSTRIPGNAPFAGRYEGGGTRVQVFGTREYGSGYPGVRDNYCVSDCNLPFFFWFVVWQPTPYASSRAQYIDSREYGSPSNDSRPGGPMLQVTIADTTTNTTLHMLSDNATASSLVDTFSNTTGCSFNVSMLSPIPLNFSDPSAPVPEQAIQYYRGSSVVLTLDGYNNTAAVLNDTSMPDTPLPGWANESFIGCVNQTIGTAVPLIGSAGAISPPIPLTTGTAALAVVLVWLFS